MKNCLLFLLMCFNCLAVYSQSGLWNMPDCSWKRKMGDRPVYSSIKMISSPDMKPGTVTKKGMPVGGIGTGGFMYNIAGSFGPFQMKPCVYEERFLKQAAFHIREEIGGNVSGHTLATEDVLPAWNKLKVGDADYSALFPKATFDYHVFQTNISLLHFSPVIRDNYKETSYPIGMFLFKVKNDKKEKVKLSFMFTFPNAPYVEVDEATCGKDNMRPCRRGLYNKVVKNNRYTSILLGADDEQNVEETQHTAWSIGTTGKTTYVEMWDGAGDGKDIWDDFMKDGKLSCKSLCESSVTPSGALCVTIQLGPNEEKVIPFALSWYFPLTTFAQGSTWKKRYTEYFPDNTTNSAAVAIVEEGLTSYNKWLEQIDGWVMPIVENKNCPDWLKAGALNELYYNTFGGSFWENGLVNGEKKLGNRENQHVSGVMECVAYPYLETFDVRHHVARVTRDLWPKMEKDILLTYSDAIASTDLGYCPHDLGGPYIDPVNSPDAYVLDYPKAKGRETTPWSEFSPKFIQQVFMYWKQYKDDPFLDDCWLSIVRSFYYQVSTDKNNDGITEMSSSEYADNKLLNAGLWITSLEALKEMATYRDDKEMLFVANVQLEKARKNTEAQLWNEKYGYYQYNEKKPYLMADAFVGQRCADVFHLPAILNEKRMYSHFHQCFDRLVKPLKDYDGDGIGDLGAANVLTQDCKPGVDACDGYNHGNEVWTGSCYNLAASMYCWGKKMDDKELMKKALLTGKGVYMQCWLNEENGFWFCTPESYWLTDTSKSRANMYQRVRGIWELMMEVTQGAASINN